MPFQTSGNVLLCKNPFFLPLACLQTGEYHEVVLIGLVPA